MEPSDQDMLAKIDIGEAVTFYGIEALLDYIGRDLAIEYWDINEIREQ